MASSEVVVIPLSRWGFGTCLNSLFMAEVESASGMRAERRWILLRAPRCEPGPGTYAFVVALLVRYNRHHVTRDRGIRAQFQLGCQSACRRRIGQILTGYITWFCWT